MDQDLLKVHNLAKKKRGQFSAIFIENACRSIKDLLYGIKNTKSLREKAVKVLSCPLNNHRAEWSSSCALAKASHIITTGITSTYELGRKESSSVIPMTQVPIANMKINTPKKTWTFRYVARKPSGSLGNRKITKPNKSWKDKGNQTLNDRDKPTSIYRWTRGRIEDPPLIKRNSSLTDSQIIQWHALNARAKTADNTRNPGHNRRGGRWREVKIRVQIWTVGWDRQK